MSNSDYDLIVIGAGSGGISSAILGNNLGKRVALVEKRRIGGECTWSGCVPSKALIKAADVAHAINHASDYGLKLDSGSRLEAGDVMTHVRSVIEQVYEGERPEAFEEMGIKVFIGEPRFMDDHLLVMGEETLSSKSFLIATGSSPLIPPIEGIGDVPYLTNENLFELERLPGSMIILGGGPIGSEMASALNRLGVKIAIVERASHLLSREEDELAGMLMEVLKDEGVDILCENTAVKATKTDKGIELLVESARSGVQALEAESLLVAAGRTPNVQGLDLEKAGVQFTSRGIQVDRTMRTSAKGIYAIGDVVGSYLFSHMAEYWATVAVPNAVLPLPIKKKADHSNVPWSTFTEPELARSGLTEREARDRYGDSIRVYRYPYNKIDRAKTDRAETGMGKIICTRKGKILGIHILGAHAADLLHEVLMVKRLGYSFDKVQNMIHAYPTYGDLVKRPAGLFYADKLRENPIVKLVQKLTRVQ